jgi:uncharacterized membrane protein
MTKSHPQRSKTAVRLNLGLLHLTRHWLRYVQIFFGLYVAFAILTPAMMHFGWTGPARVLYTLYSPFCHQFGFRSLFLFGEQAAYPRAITGTSQTPFEAHVVNDRDFLELYTAYYYQYRRAENPPDPNVQNLTSEWTLWFQFASRDFVGNEQMGYKMTLCARDIAIYSAIFVGGLIYAYPPVRRRLRPAPLWLYALLGLGPIALDGFSQLFGYPPFNWWTPRETLPIFRVVTGALFGLMNVWLAFPYLELSMRETREQLEAKLTRAGIER